MQCEYRRWLAFSYNARQRVSAVSIHVVHVDTELTKGVIPAQKASVCILSRP